MTQEVFADVEEETIIPEANAPATHYDVGVHPDIEGEEYHALPGISKSGLWKIHKQTPAHYKYEEREEKDYFDFGHAVHFGILQPELFEKKIVRGPATRRGNAWKDLKSHSSQEGKIVLVEKEYENALAVRDAAHANPTVSSLLTGGPIEFEHSGIWIDKETGVQCRCRPDAYRSDVNLMIDLKSTISAHPDDFARSVINHGYHAQEAFYSDGYTELGKPVDGFVFIAWEKKKPFSFSVFELPPSIVEEGRAIMRQSLETFRDCSSAGIWPGYSDEVVELKFKPWSYEMTMPPKSEDDE